MLIKLLKYELKSAARTFLPLYGALLGISALNTGLSLLSGADFFSSRNAANTIMFLGFYGVSIAIGAVTFFIIIRRFSRSLLGDEGYLMFTLPVPVWQHIISKLISAVLWSLLSGLTVSAASLLLLAGSGRYYRLNEFFYEFDSMKYSFFTVFGIQFETAMILLMIIGFLSLCATILLVYLSIAIGHLMRRHKTLASIAFFVGINTIVANPVQISFWLYHNQGRGLLLFITLILAFAGFSALYFILTWYILSRKLNLE